ncbi:efflux RND transporter permease subunit [Candidatus Nitronereus thalassa]|uniref:MMPL family transporter n=1 Tax=Candidatus Nitronereus thalassa TaxID=3020898 RepID=A0ABU3KBA1_9BACT|nr:MMPL family transporter [Candidatus Nitronereus thalassa]MDT7043706.1 MMPL family transporter [Candidatus Nitronereus thalassa]
MSFSSIGVYDKLVLARPVVTLLVVGLLAAVFGNFAFDFKLDASADSLVLENDEALRDYRSIRARYGSDDYLILTYSPEQSLFQSSVLDDLTQLRDSLDALPRIASVTSILDVPLIQSPPLTLSELSEGAPTLEDPTTDPTLARREFLSSPLYRNLLISPDGSTTALQISFDRDKIYYDLLNKRNQLREKRLQLKLSEKETRELATVSRRFNAYTSERLDQQAEDIATIRSIMDRHKGMAELHLGGVPMIVADSIAFIRHDLKVFGAGVLGFIIIILTIAFRNPRWVILSLMICLVTGLIMIGFLGFLDWRVTVVSSNFLSLLLIITLSLLVHLIVRYRELHEEHPHKDQRFLVKETIRTKVMPCVYTALTTMVAFGSLVFSDIRPVIDFGWMMVIGIMIAFVLAFTAFPAALMLFSPGKAASRRDFTETFTGFLAQGIRTYSKSTLLICAMLAVVCVVGMSRLSVQNRFIDYYKESTEIYQGMELIDQKLGGTTPLDVIIDAPNDWQAEQEPDITNDPFADETTGNAGITNSSYWFNSFKLDDIANMHAYLDNLSDTGKVLSLHTAFTMLQRLKRDGPLDDLFLSVLYNRLPQNMNETLIEPYFSEEGDQLRFSVRVYESDTSLNRQELLKKIRNHFVEEFGLNNNQVQLTGMMVLYNNMLQSLFRSQIVTLGFVFIAIFVMFMILFRSVKVATIAIIPNSLAAALVLGIMGWFKIPLDIMTITIAAISVGIAVDDTIHYVHRYKTEFQKDGDYWASVRRAHKSIGRAMHYTSLTITLGFSILALSEFVPTVYFGLLTGFAMVSALLVDLTLLPLLFVLFRPLGYKTSTSV